MENNIIEVEERQLAIRERSFELSQRELKPFTATQMIPQHLRDIGSLMILDKVAKKYKMDLLFLAQEMFMVKGKFGISGKLAIALINKSGVLDGRLKFEVRSQPFGVRAFGEIDGEEIKGMWIDDALISANNWERNQLWNSQKELMARYRSATYFARMEMPEVLMGFHTNDELEDITSNEPDQITAGSGGINTVASEKSTESFTEAEIESGATDEPQGDLKGLNDVVMDQETAKEPKRKRTCKAVTAKYAEMEAFGFKRGHLAQVVRYFDLVEDNIETFMAGIASFKEEFYSSHEDLTPNPEKAPTVEEEDKVVTLEKVDELHAPRTQENMGKARLLFNDGVTSEDTGFHTIQWDGIGIAVNAEKYTLLIKEYEELAKNLEAGSGEVYDGAFDSAEEATA